MHDCDVMLAIGARFDDRITGRLNAFSPGSTKIHVDIDPSSHNKTVHCDIAIVGDAARVLEQMIAAWKEGGYKPNRKAPDKWWAPIDQRSDERRVGKGWVRTCRSRWSRVD